MRRILAALLVPIALLLSDFATKGEAAPEAVPADAQAVASAVPPSPAPRSIFCDEAFDFTIPGGAGTIACRFEPMGLSGGMDAGGTVSFRGTIRAGTTEGRFTLEGPEGLIPDKTGWNARMREMRDTGKPKGFTDGKHPFLGPFRFTNDRGYFSFQMDPLSWLDAGDWRWTFRSGSNTVAVSRSFLDAERCERWKRTYEDAMAPLYARRRILAASAEVDLAEMNAAEEGIRKRLEILRRSELDQIDAFARTRMEDDPLLDALAYLKDAGGALERRVGLSEFPTFEASVDGGPFQGLPSLSRDGQPVGPPKEVPNHATQLLLPAFTGQTVVLRVSLAARLLRFDWERARMIEGPAGAEGMAVECAGKEARAGKDGITVVVVGMVPANRRIRGAVSDPDCIATSHAHLQGHGKALEFEIFVRPPGVSPALAVPSPDAVPEGEGGESRAVAALLADVALLRDPDTGEWAHRLSDRRFDAADYGTLSRPLLRMLAKARAQGFSTPPSEGAPYGWEDWAGTITGGTVRGSGGCGDPAGVEAALLTFLDSHPDPACRASGTAEIRLPGTTIRRMVPYRDRHGVVRTLALFAPRAADERIGRAVERILDRWAQILPEQPDSESISSKYGASLGFVLDHDLDALVAFRAALRRADKPAWRAAADILKRRIEEKGFGKRADGPRLPEFAADVPPANVGLIGEAALHLGEAEWVAAAKRWIRRRLANPRRRHASSHTDGGGADDASQADFAAFLAILLGGPTRYDFPAEDGR